MADLDKELADLGCPYEASDHRAPIWLNGYQAGLNSTEICDGCGALRIIREVLDGDKLCQSCCDAWVRAEGQAVADHKENEAEAARIETAE